jgi:hypothetical protein
MVGFVIRSAQRRKSYGALYDPLLLIQAHPPGQDSRQGSGEEDMEGSDLPCRRMIHCRSDDPLPSNPGSQSRKALTSFV